MIVAELLTELFKMDPEKQVVFADELPLLRVVEMENYVVLTDENDYVS